MCNCVLYTIAFVNRIPRSPLGCRCHRRRHRRHHHHHTSYSISPLTSTPQRAIVSVRFCVRRCKFKCIVYPATKSNGKRKLSSLFVRFPLKYLPLHSSFIYLVYSILCTLCAYSLSIRVFFLFLFIFHSHFYFCCNYIQLAQLTVPTLICMISVQANGQRTQSTVYYLYF